MTNLVVNWKQLNIKTTQDIDKYLDNFKILFAYNSGKIENDKVSYHDTREVFENSKLLNFSGDLRTIFEIQNQKVCYEYLKEKIIRKEPISICIIKKIHELLTQGTYDEKMYDSNDERPGEFKKHDYIIGKNEVGSAPDSVENDLIELLSEVKNYVGENILKVATYLHAKFEFIHPFADGNGRVGRTLLNYFLMINDNPPLIIYDEDKNIYYQALEEYDENENLDPMYDFIKQQLQKTWAKSRIMNPLG